MYISDAFDGRQNNFNLLRLFAAVLVVFGHSWSLTSSGPDPLRRLIGYDAGSIGLAIFFTLSGFLITKSASENETLRFLLLRCIRILPALCIAILFETFVVGPLFYDGTTAEYFGNRSTWVHLKGIFLFAGSFEIKGVFQNNPLTGVNGSTWTLPIEFTLYICATLAATIGLIKGNRYHYVLLFWLCAFLYVKHSGLSFPRNVGPEILNKVAMYPFVLWGGFFCIGGAMWIYRTRIKLDPGLALCAIIGLCTSRMIWDYTFLLCWAYLTIYAGLGLKAVRARTPIETDISYGVYVFAWPIQQWAIATQPAAMDPVFLAAVSIPVSMLVGFASWNLVEKPVLALRGRIVPARGRAQQSASGIPVSDIRPAI